MILVLYGEAKLMAVCNLQQFTNFWHEVASEKIQEKQKQNRFWLFKKYILNIYDMAENNAKHIEIVLW